MKPKDPAAVALGQKRWKGVPARKRSEIARAAVSERWQNATEAERAAQGARLAKARKDAAAARKKESLSKKKNAGD